MCNFYLKDSIKLIKEEIFLSPGEDFLKQEFFLPRHLHMKSFRVIPSSLVNCVFMCEF